MSNAALAFLAGLGGGIVQGKLHAEDKDRKDREEQRRQEEHDARMEETRRKQAGDKALRDASQPVTVGDGATVTGISDHPTVYDNADVAASDVRQANLLSERGMPGQQDATGEPLQTDGSAPAAAAGMPPATLTRAPTVGGKVYQDSASAQAAATAANSPQAVRARQVAALAGIDPDRADKMRLTGVQVDQAEQQQADANLRRKISVAGLNGGHQGIADFINSSEIGPMAGLKMQAVASPDGKTVTYNKVDAQGNLTPIPSLTFANDASGIAIASAMVDKGISPVDRVKMLREDQKESREQAESASKIKKNEAEAKKDSAYADYLTGAKSDAERARATKGAGAGDKPFKLDEDDKLRLNEASKGVQEATRAYGESLKSLMPGQKPEDSPAVQFAANQLKTAKLTHLRTNIELGQISPESMATQILSVAKNSQDVLKSITEIAGVGGTEFGDKVAAVVQASDAWKRMNPGKAAAPTTASGKAISKAPPGSVELQPDGTYAAPGAKPKPAAAAGTAPIAPASAPAAGTPADAAGKRLDQARQVVRQLRATAPGLAAGRQKLDEHAEAVRAAEDELSQAQAAYERAVQAGIRPTFADSRPAAAQRGL